MEAISNWMKMAKREIINRPTDERTDGQAAPGGVIAQWYKRTPLLLIFERIIPSH